MNNNLHLKFMIMQTFGFLLVGTRCKYTGVWLRKPRTEDELLKEFFNISTDKHRVAAIREENGHLVEVPLSGPRKHFRGIAIDEFYGGPLSDNL